MMAYEISLKLGDESVLFSCTTSQDDRESASRSLYSIDLIISKSEEQSLKQVSIGSDASVVFRGQTGEPQELTSGPVYRFILECLFRALSNQQCAARILVPREIGYLVRADIFQLRMKDCPYVDYATSFANSQQSVGLAPSNDIDEDLIKFIESSLGVVILSDGATGDQLNVELDRRFKFPWLSAHLRQRKSLALVEGGRSSPDRPSITSGIYLTAQALGIDLVVLDSQGHWAEGPKYAQWRKAFIPLNLETTDDLSSRIVKAINEYGSVDGIISYCDMYAASIATAAQELGLPTAPPSAYEIITDKFKTSVFEGHRAFRASSVDEAQEITERESLDYPMIVKPCNGWCSEGVAKVHDSASLLKAVRAIDMDRHGNNFVIEKYCDGPEVDANFILLNGEVLFCEISDDVPKGAELDRSSTVTAPSNFHELANVLPSNLPKGEQEVLMDALHQTLLRLGIQSGFYHLEARVQNSSTQYTTVDDQRGIVDLHIRNSPSKDKPSAWLIEINPRPPGIVTSQATRTTYGIDYWGISMLIAINEKDPVGALSFPFSTESGSQYWCAALHIPANVGGIFDSDDVFVELAERRPDLAAHISNSGCFLRRGDEVPSPDTGLNPMVGYVNVFSRVSRQHLLELAQSVRENIRFSII